MEDADDSYFPQNFLASEIFCDILDAKLLLEFPILVEKFGYEAVCQWAWL